MRILITGGSGFIGTRLIGMLLNAGHQITIFDKNISSRYPTMTVVGDVCDKTALVKAAIGQEFMYHLAAEHTDNVHPASLYDDVNVGGAENVIAAANAANINKIIFTSSVAVYPLNIGMPDESTQAVPFNKYGESKYAAEQVFAGWSAADNSRTVVTIRSCAIFGEGNRGNVYNLLSQIYKRQFIMVGAGNNKKSIGYVGNIAKFLMFCLDLSAGYHLFNYADKPDLTTAELVNIAENAFGKNGNNKFRIPYRAGLLAGYTFDLLAGVTGKKFPISALRIKKFCADTTVSVEHLSKTAFRPPYSLKEALEETIKAEFNSR